MIAMKKSQVYEWNKSVRDGRASASALSVLSTSAKDQNIERVRNIVRSGDETILRRYQRMYEYQLEAFTVFFTNI
jgi:hypothetical protein